MTLSSLASKFKSNLGLLYGEDEAYALFLIAIEHYLKLDRSTYLLKKEEVIPDKLGLKLELLLKELLTGKPIQYILGETYFYGLPFKVNTSVLIPRPETEELVEWVIEKVKGLTLQERLNGHHPDSYLERNDDHLSILDIGTGSGCIAISLKKNLPEAKVFAMDISSESIVTAKGNAALNHVDVEFIEQDILDMPNVKRPSPYSIIISNPPYITLNEKGDMHANVLDNEPHQALFVSNEQPLVFYEAIADFALLNLQEKGLLFFEINEYLAKETITLLDNKGLINIELRKDMQGKDRMICCERQA